MHDYRYRFFFIFGTVIDVTCLFFSPHNGLQHSASQHSTFIVIEPHLFFLPAQIQDHFIPSGTRLAQEPLDYKFSCMMRTCSPDREWAKAHALWPSAQDRAVCTERAQLDERSLSLLSRTERESRQETEKDEQRERAKKRETYEKRERHEMRRERLSRVYVQNASVCTFETRVCLQNASVQCDARVLNVHTGAF